VAVTIWGAALYAIQVVTADLLREACEGRPPVDDARESESDDDHYFD